MLFGIGLCAVGLLSLSYPKFVSGGKTSLAGDVPLGLTGECLCHPEALHAGELIASTRDRTDSELNWKILFLREVSMKGDFI